MLYFEDTVKKTSKQKENLSLRILISGNLFFCLFFLHFPMSALNFSTLSYNLNTSSAVQMDKNFIFLFYFVTKNLLYNFLF